MGGEIPRNLLKEINEALSERIGLRFSEDRYSDLERGLVTACGGFKNERWEECIGGLVRGRLSRDQIEQLASTLTVGETYFFRESKSLAILEENIFPEIVRRRRKSTGIVRVWSAGCSSGEEVYTLAIILQRLIPDWKDWGITILGTDINPAALKKAEAGVYGEWSFRGLGPDFKARHFTEAGKKRYRIKDGVRQIVRFSYLNLAEDSYPALATNTLAMDVILCRNVLMYFSEQTIHRVTRKFLESLVTGGWLVTSPSEASPRYFTGFTTVNFPWGIFFRKPAIDAQTIPASETSPEIAPPPQLSRERRSEALPVRPCRPEPGPLRRMPSREGESAVRAGAMLDKLGVLARENANTGRLSEALDCCEKAFEIDPLAPAFHYLKAGILQENGETDGAISALRKTLFLEKDFAMAHFALANLYRQSGRPADARRHFATAEQLFAKMPPGEFPMESEGMSAARLRQIASANLRSLT